MKIKQRIVGILVIVALAIVFVPIFFNKSVNENPSNQKINQTSNTGSTSSTKSTTNLAIPSDNSTRSVSTPIGTIAKTKPITQPAKNSPTTDNFTKAQTSSLAIPAKPISTEKTAVISTSETKLSTEKSTVSASTHLPQKESLIKSEHKIPSKTIKPVQKQTTISKINNERLKSKHSRSQQIAKLWSVQLGSFSDEVNAKKLIKNLKAKRFAVYSHTLKAKHGQIVKVFVGPIKTREEAEVLVKRLDHVAHVKGIIVKYNTI